MCSSGNGGCSQLCLAFPGGRTCLCGHGFLPNNEMSCVTDPRCPAGTKPCLRGEECLPLEQFCDGDPDCADNSDEICEEMGSYLRRMCSDSFYFIFQDMVLKYIENMSVALFTED